jgi:RES domain-containing protein
VSSTVPDEDLVDRVNELGATKVSIEAYRHTASGRDPLSGEGARQNGGRWNPAGHPTVYLAAPERACAAEFSRMADRVGAPARALLERGRDLHRLVVEDLPVLDLTPEDTLDHVGLSPDDVADDDFAACQAVGQAAHFLAYGGVMAPSATGVGVVVAAFEDRVRPGQVRLMETVPFDWDRYQRLITP